MRKIPNYIDINKITIIPKVIKEDRYYLRFKIKDKITTKKLLVIMKNPSKSLLNFDLKTYNSNNRYLDITTYNVLEYANDNDYSDVKLVNLYSYYDTDPKEINLRYGFIPRSDPSKNIIIANRKSYDENIEVIKSISKNLDNTEIIFSWGGNSGIYKGYYDDRIKEIINIFSNYNQYEVIKPKQAKPCKYPLHPLRWKSNYILKIYTPR